MSEPVIAERIVTVGGAVHEITEWIDMSAPIGPAMRWAGPYGLVEIDAENSRSRVHRYSHLSIDLNE